MNSAQEIFDYLLTWLPAWDKLQGVKNELTEKELFNVYTKYNRKYLKMRDKLRATILANKALYNECKALASKSYLFDILLDGWSWDINKSQDDSPLLAFLPFPEQRRLLQQIQDGDKHMHTEKSRRQGASALFRQIMKAMLAHGEHQVMFATHKDLTSLDAGDADTGKNSTFEGVRWLLDLSLWMPDDWRDRNKYWTKNNKQYVTKSHPFPLIVVGTNQLKGEVLGKGTAVGLAGHVIFVDELDPVCELFPNQADSIFGAFSQSVNRMFLYSTYRGTEFPFYRIKNRNDTKHWDFIRLDWRDNPTCNNDWYESAKAKVDYDEVLIAREIDIDPLKTRQGRVFPTLDDGNCIQHYEERPQDWIKVAGADFGGGTSATAFILGKFNIRTGVMVLTNMYKSTKIDEVDVANYLREHNYHNVVIASDQSVSYQAGAVGKDWKSLLRNEGIITKSVYNKDVFRVQASIRQAFKNKKTLLIDTSTEEGKRLYADLRGYSYKKDKINKDDYSHTGDALVYLYRDLFINSDSGLI